MSPTGRPGLGHTENFIGAPYLADAARTPSHGERRSGCPPRRSRPVGDPRRWWIDGFTDGADPEYEEQILPLAAAELRRCARVLDVGCGDGQISRLAWSARCRARRRRRSDVEPDPTSPRERGGGPAYVRVRAAALPFAGRSRSMPSVACLVFEHIDEVDEAIAEVARVLRPGGRFCFFLNHPLLQTPNSGWIDDQFARPARAVLADRPLPRRGRDDRGGRKDVFIRFIHRPLRRYINALAGQRPADRADGRAGPTRPASSPGPRSTPAARTIPRLLVSPAPADRLSTTVRPWSRVRAVR